jgi:ABC-2 type transport system ATP-binding protein
MSIVEARSISQCYGRRRILDGLDLDIDEGVVGLLGPNGAGKTTLLSILCTLRPPASGSLRIFGVEATHLAERQRLRRRIGFLPQAFGYYPSFSAQEFVEYAGWLRGVDEDIEEGARVALEHVDLVERAHDRLKNLSGGMLRRVGIATAIVGDPDLVILDEPTVGLDPEQRVQLRTVIRDIARRGTVLLSTHLVDDVSSTCDQVIVLFDGRIVFQGTPEGLAASGDTANVGDTAIERGYTAIIGDARRRASA